MGGLGKVVVEDNALQGALIPYIMMYNDKTERRSDIIFQRDLWDRDDKVAICFLLMVDIDC